MTRLRALAAVSVFSAAITASVTGATAEPPGGIISEVKLGLLEHDVSFFGHGKEPGRDINAELLFTSPDFLSAIFAPRPHLGVSINTAGATSLAYAGLTWSFYPFNGGAIGHLWFSPFLGGALHNGELRTDDPNRKENGTRALFHLGGEVGIDVTEQVNVSIYYEHSSNANLGGHNEGINSAGVRLGWRF